MLIILNVKKQNAFGLFLFILSKIDGWSSTILDCEISENNQSRSVIQYA